MGIHVSRIQHSVKFDCTYYLLLTLPYLWKVSQLPLLHMALASKKWLPFKIILKDLQSRRLERLQCRPSHRRSNNRILARLIDRCYSKLPHTLAAILYRCRLSIRGAPILKNRPMPAHGRWNFTSHAAACSDVSIFKSETGKQNQDEKYGRIAI